MRTRNADSPKPAAVKRTPPARKSAAAKAALATPKQAKSVETSSTAIASSDSKPEQSPAPTGTTAPEAKVRLGTKSMVKKTPGRNRGPAGKATTTQTAKSAEIVNEKVEESPKNEKKAEIKDLEHAKTEESVRENSGKSKEKKQITIEAEQTVSENMDKIREKEVSKEEEISAKDEDKSTKGEQGTKEVELTPVENIEEPRKLEETVEDRGIQLGDCMDVANSSENKQFSSSKEGEVTKENLKEEMTNDNSKEDAKIETSNMEGNDKDEFQGEAWLRGEEYGDDGRLEEYGDQVDFEDPEEEELLEDDVEEPAEEAQELEDEHRELTAVAKERRIKKEHEIFVGGLDRDASEEDVRKVFEKIGEVVEVRLHKNLSTNKNKGYAFVKFASKEHAKCALSEMKNPVICGKRCGTAPSEDNDTLFLGNVCNTWTKEAIRQKLKDYGVEGVENITLVPDVQHEGLSRGFAFLEFSCHADAMLAYKRLQKPDVVFGHSERTAKVAFAEPLREPDPEIMAKVKTVFLDGLPPHWDEEQVRGQFKIYGEIIRIVLARNMSTAKRKDFGFVDFSTHEAAVSCIDGVNNTDIIDGKSKIKVKARLSNPLPKTQAVKGGMSGGFRIGRGGVGTFSRFGRGFTRGGQGGHQFNWPNVQRGRDFNKHGQTSRFERNYDHRYAEFHGRQSMERGGRRGTHRGGYYGSGRVVASAGPSRPNFRPWDDGPDRGYGEHSFSRRQPFPPEEAFDRPFGGRYYDDPYGYEEGAQGMKRPFYMTYHDVDPIEPSRTRPRLDYSDQAVSSFRGAHYRDPYRAGGDIYSHDYYGSDFRSYPTYQRGNRSYGGGGGYYH